MEPQHRLRWSERIVPGISDSIEFTRVNRWYPLLVYSHPGLYRAQRAAIAKVIRAPCRTGLTSYAIERGDPNRYTAQEPNNQGKETTC